MTEVALNENNGGIDRMYNLIILTGCIIILTECQCKCHFPGSHSNSNVLVMHYVCIIIILAKLPVLI